MEPTGSGEIGVSAVCTKCGQRKERHDFYACSKSKSGIRPRCKACMREYEVQNADRIAAYKAEYRLKNAAELARKTREWVRANPERVRLKNKNKTELQRAADKERIRRWKMENPDRWRALRRKHKWLRSGADAESAEYAEIVRADPCSYCGGVGGTVDHIVPLDQGGRHHWSNFTGACAWCNKSKHTTSAILFMARMVSG
jgi:5-methylcytosine-specific restriction endonuclease McrA